MTKRYTRRNVLIGGAASTAAISLGMPYVRAQGAWPNRPVTVICPWAAGGGTDATARIVASGAGEGAQAALQRRQSHRRLRRRRPCFDRHAPRPTATHIGIITVEISMMHWQGLTEFKPDSYTPLALMNEDPPGIQVNASSPYKTVKELADAIKAVARRAS